MTNLTKSRQKLIALYQEMYEMTRPECDHCRCPHSCCSPEYCEATIETAPKYWQITLQPTDHPTLPLMGLTGCIAAPHLRPMCTMHTCDMNGFGFKRDDLTGTWTKKYFRLRDRITKLEFRLFG